MKALALFSGGLDSILSVCLVKEQGIDVEAVCFVSTFFDDQETKKTAVQLKIPLVSVDITKNMLTMIQHPVHGFGKGTNPCIDCHIFMIKTTGVLMEQRKAKFMFSGEVLGERPKSQNRRALEIIDSESGWGDYLVRPLTAKNLSPTFPEKKGWIKREKLMDIRGRSRKEQFELAQRFNITHFPQPAGGCLLTDPNFSRRVKYVLATGRLNANEVELLKVGRHFCLDHQTRIIVGRKRAENLMIEKLATPGDLLLKAKDYPGPTALFRGNFSFNLLYEAASIVARYSDVPDEIAEVEYYRAEEGPVNTLKVKRFSERDLSKLKIEANI